MHPTPEKFDVFILGSGPAGLCAAIRLLDMGYTVGMIEQKEFPRPQIGESLSPGIFNIFEYLHASHLLDDNGYLKNVSAKVLWESKENIYHRSGVQSGGLIVDRGKLDKDLLNFTVSKGLYLLQPAKLKDQIHAENMWTLTVLYNKTEMKFNTSIVLDARGRKGTLIHERVTMAPTSIAVWTHLPSHAAQEEARIEALEDGWLWGSPVSGTRYRIMAFTDYISLKKNNIVHLKDFINKSKLFNTYKNKMDDASIETCSVASYVHIEPWKNQLIKIGEAAFTLDPLSSTGVEKAMRFSLQVAIAVNTYLKDTNSSHPKDFYEEKLIESAVSHAHWTADYYRQAWASHRNLDFWDKRTNFKLDISKCESTFTHKLQNEFNKEKITIENKQSEPIRIDCVLNKLWNEEITLSPHIRYQSVYAINHDLIEIKQAIYHPNLTRPIVYLGQVELNPIFKFIKGYKVYEAIGHLSHSMSTEQSKKILVFLLSNQLLLVNQI